MWALICERSSRQLSEQAKKARSLISTNMLTKDSADAQHQADQRMRVNGAPVARPATVASLTETHVIPKVASA
jgi:hypothetical protein